MGDTKMYNCLSDCIYMREGQEGQKFCFAMGDLQVECNDEEMEGSEKPPMEGSEQPPMEGSEQPPMEGTEKPPMDVLVGAVAFDKGCNRGGYGIFTQISKFSSWVSTQIANNGGGEVCLQ